MPQVSRLCIWDQVGLMPAGAGKAWRKTQTAARGREEKAGEGPCLGECVGSLVAIRTV